MCLGLSDITFITIVPVLVPAIPIFNPKLPSTVRMEDKGSPASSEMQVEMTDLRWAEYDDFSRVNVDDQPQFIQNKLSSSTVIDWKNYADILRILMIPVYTRTHIEVNDYSSEGMNRGNGVSGKNINISRERDMLLREK